MRVSEAITKRCPIAHLKKIGAGPFVNGGSIPLNADRCIADECAWWDEWPPGTHAEPTGACAVIALVGAVDAVANR